MIIYIIKAAVVIINKNILCTKWKKNPWKFHDEAVTGYFVAKDILDRL